jgi:pyruvate, water dikinase
MEEKSDDFIKWFSELNKDSVNIGGGKAANLAEMYNLKIQVPLGFVITTNAYDYFIEKSGVKEEMDKILGKINYEDVKTLDESTQKIRDLIINSKIPEDLREDIIEAYETLSSNHQEGASAHDLLKTSPEDAFVAVRSSATTEDLEGASFAGQQDTFLNVKGKDNLIEYMKKAVASLFTSRATYYRNKKGFKHEGAKLAVIVQKMIDSEKSGVIFSKDPSYKNDNVIIEAVFGLGEGIVSGKITPDRYVVSNDFNILDKKIMDKKMAITRNSSGDKSEVKLTEEKSKSEVLKESEVKELSKIALRLEDHYKKPQDIEFAIEGGEIYIVQTRAITTIEKRTDAGSVKELKGEIILEGLAASPGIAFGKTKVVKVLTELNKVNQGDVLVTKMTNPDMVVVMQKASAIITDEGGMTSHAAIVSREMGIPAVVGTREATTKIKENEIVTVDGFNGKIYKGKVSENVEKEVLGVEKETKTKIKVIVDLPSAASRASKSGVKEIGLLRLEGIIAESGKHPNLFLKNKNFEDYEDIIFKGVQKIAEHFDGLWVRTSDIRSDEFHNLEGAPEEIEVNPMLGMHGVRYSIRNPEILKSEFKALKKVSEQRKKIGLLLPQIISVEEVQKVKEFLKEVDFQDVQIGVMVETPASVQIIKELCEEGIDFISFGTNDLTQYTLAIDRGNEQVQEIYDEMNPAVLKQIKYVIRIAKRHNVETSICGQSGSKKPMVKFLVENNIDSISVNPDAAKEISDYVYELENEGKEVKNDMENNTNSENDNNVINQSEDNNITRDDELSTQENPEPQGEVHEDDGIELEIPKDNLIPVEELQESEIIEAEENQQEKEKDEEEQKNSNKEISEESKVKLFF